jgi:CRP-like cAMP-binding protein
MKREIGQPGAEGTRLDVRLTHQNLANAIGTTRVTITRLLSKLKNEGAITLDRDRHIILKKDSFKNIADW